MVLLVLVLLCSCSLAAQSPADFEKFLTSPVEGRPVEVLSPFKNIPGSMQKAVAGLQNPESCSGSLFAIGRWADEEALEAILDFFPSPGRGETLDARSFDCKVDAIFALGMVRKFSSNDELKKKAVEVLGKIASPNNPFWDGISWRSPRHRSKKGMVFYLAGKARFVLKKSE